MDRYSIAKGKEPLYFIYRRPKLKEDLEQFIELYIRHDHILHGQPCFSRTKMDVKNFLSHIFIRHLEDLDTEDFPSGKLFVRISPKGELGIAVDPENLYTLLIFNGILIPYEKTKNLCTFVDSDETEYSVREGVAKVVRYK